MYIVEGNIGVGKSTLLNIIKSELPHISVVQEPVKAWHTDAHGESILTKFYEDTNRWAYTMETWTLFTRVQEHVREQQIPNLKIMERSIYSGYYCFARNGYEHGQMNEIEWYAYKQWFTELVSKTCNAPKGFIYLQSDPIVCHERSKKRARSGEELIPLSYFEQIHEQHESFLISKKEVLPTIKDLPVLVLDASQEFAGNNIRKQEFIHKIREFVTKTI